MNKLLTILLCVCAFLSCRKAPLSDRLDALCASVFAADSLSPGAAVLLMRGDSILFRQTYGYATLGDSPALIGNDTRFCIASCSKAFTAMAVLQLAAEGKLSLDDPMGRFFPEYTDPLWQQVRVRHLLSQSSGIPDERGYLSREEKIRGNEQLATDYLSCLDHLHFEPGSQYEYINPTFVLLGYLVERVSGEDFYSYVRRRIFLPAGMNSTLYYHPDSVIPHMAHGYESTAPSAAISTDSDKPQESSSSLPRSSGLAVDHKDSLDSSDSWFQKSSSWREYDYGEETFFATRPDGGIYTTVSDLVRWERALRSTSSGADVASNLIPSAEGPALMAEAFSPQVQVAGSPWSDYQNRPGTSYGFAWFLEPADGLIYHTGDNGGFKALFLRRPADDLLLIILANRPDWDRYALAKHLLAELDK